MASNIVVPKPQSDPFGDWYTFSIEMPIATILGTTGAGAVSTLELTETVPLDFICTHMSVTAMRENPGNANFVAAGNPLSQQNDLLFTQRFKMNVRDSAAQTAWIETDLVSGSSFDPVPVALFCGPNITPLPGIGRPLFQGSQLTVKFEAETQAARPLSSNIRVLVVSFMGRRMDSMTQQERQIVSVDPRTNGSAWLYVNGFPLTRGDSPDPVGGKGPAATQNCNFTRKPWNFIWEGLSCILTSDGVNPAPVSSASALFSYSNNTNRKQTQLCSTIPYSRDRAPMPGGGAAGPFGLPAAPAALANVNFTAPFNAVNWDEFFDGAFNNAPRWVKLHCLAIIASQSSFAFTGVSQFSPFTNASQTQQYLHFLLWGSRSIVNEPYIAYPFLQSKNQPIQQGGPGGPMINPNTGFPVSQPPY